ncbi:MAG: amidohydrolase family protein [Chitinophagaceae bacterium]|nr:amidohydrolase family protein [Chitinophagaceae bacterium]
MKNIFLSIITLFTVTTVFSQPDIYPAPENKETILIKNATIHVGNGTIINNGSILIRNSKIEKVGSDVEAPAGTVVYDVKGKQVYPGLISPVTNVGTKDVGGMVPGTNDYDELGDINPNIRSIVAYNTDNHVINVLRTNGILLANVVPQSEGGGDQLISGSSSVVQLDAWNWEDAAYKMDGQIHVNMPSLIQRRSRFSFFNPQAQSRDPEKEGLEKIESLKQFFREAQYYLTQKNHAETNLKFEATKGLFDKTQKLFVHCNAVKEMLMAIDFKKDFGFDVVIVGGDDSWQIAPLLRANNIPVILNQMHSLPASYDDDVDQPFKTPAILQKAGVLFAISDVDGTTRGRNLMYNAGTAAAYGLTKEQALSAITLNTAKILGIDDKTGTIEAGKDANIIISEGDILNMEESIVDLAFIQGRKINLDNKQWQLSDRYQHKYGIQIKHPEQIKAQ